MSAKFIGTKNFHNYTVRLKPTQGQSKRFVKELSSEIIEMEVFYII